MVTALNNTGVFCRQAHRRDRPRGAGGRSGRGWCVLLVLISGSCSEPRSAGKRPGVRPKGSNAQGAPHAATRPAGPRLVALPECPAGPPKAGDAQGGNLRVHLDTEPEHLHPLRENSAALELVTRGLIYESLLEYRAGTYQPALASSWELSEDGTRLLLQVGAGINWHDGRPLTAIDVQASLEAALRSSSPLRQTRASLVDVARIDVLPERTVRIRLKQPAPIVLRALCEIPIVPERLVRGPKLEIARLSRAPVGTGPFRFVSWEQGQRIQLEANRDGWRGPPGLGRLVFEIDDDAPRSLARIRRGELEVLPRLPVAYFPEQILPPVLGDRVTAQLLDDGRLSLLLINHRRPSLQDLVVRQVLAGAWNRRRLAEDVHQGLVLPSGPSPFGNIPEPGLDPATARSRLDEAGYRDGDGDGVRERAGQTLRFTLLYAIGGATIEREAKRFAQELGRAGIALTTAAVSPADLDEKLRSGSFDLAPVEWHGRKDEDPRPLFAATGTFNYGAFRSPRIEGLLAELVAARPPAGGAVRQRLATALGEELPVIFLYQHLRVALVAANVRGLCHDGGGLDFREVRLSP
jgi:peptide/nickel transport system substrate-binding protein